MASSPTQRTLKLLRDEGYTAEVVEKWIPQARRRKDLFNCIDVVGIHPDHNGVLGVQATTASNLSKRKQKSVALDSLKVWLTANNRFELHGWRKGGPRGKRKVWVCNRQEIDESHLHSGGCAAGSGVTADAVHTEEGPDPAPHGGVRVGSFDQGCSEETCAEGIPDRAERDNDRDTSREEGEALRGRASIRKTSTRNGERQ